MPTGSSPHRRSDQVRGAPERDVLAEEAVPDVVEGEADEREGAAADDASGRRRARTSRRAILTAAGRASPSGEANREEAGGEDAEEAGEDEVMRGVRERARVTPLVDVEGDVPVHPEEREEQ